MGTDFAAKQAPSPAPASRSFLANVCSRLGESRQFRTFFGMLPYRDMVVRVKPGARITRRMTDYTGGKGQSLFILSNFGNVPEAFTITIPMCEKYRNTGEISQRLERRIRREIRRTEEMTGLTFGMSNKDKPPLLFSVRSGAKKSMPGMMDTVTNLGFNDEIADKWICLEPEKERFILDSQVRFIESNGKEVLRIKKGGESDPEVFADKFEKTAGKGRALGDLSVEELRGLRTEYENVIDEWDRKKGTGKISEDAYAQLFAAIKAVFQSPYNLAAMAYKQVENIDPAAGTAVNVQMMVFGNDGELSGTAVLFSANPDTGEKIAEKDIYGSAISNAQGEDIVGGTKTVASITLDNMGPIPKCIHEQVLDIVHKIDGFYKGIVDMEITWQNIAKAGEPANVVLYLLQARLAKLSGAAICRDLYRRAYVEKTITPKQALLRLTGDHTISLFLPRLHPEDAKANVPFAKGAASAPGAMHGQVVFTAKDAVEMRQADPEAFIVLVRDETNTDDVEGMRAANAVLTARGAGGSHAVLVCRSWGKATVVGTGINIDAENETFTAEVNGKAITVRKGDWVTVDGNSKNVYLGKLRLIDPVLTPEAEELLSLSRRIAKGYGHSVLANADDAETARKARYLYGAEGIGLFRIEHNLLHNQDMKKLIMARTEGERKAPRKKVEEFLYKEIKGVLEVMDGLPVIVRLLDPPLHEFLDKPEQLSKELAKLAQGTPEYNRKLEEIKRVGELWPVNPMMADRGIRIQLDKEDGGEELLRMQVRAAVGAAADLLNEGKHPMLELMLSLTIKPREIDLAKEIMMDEAGKVIEKKCASSLQFEIGTMVETPNASDNAAPFACRSRFFSWGTNDLTQMTLGYSRDDMGKRTPSYIRLGIFRRDVFETIDPDLADKIRKANKIARKANPKLKIGGCGEHFGDPISIKEHFAGMGFDTISCAGIRVPGAWLSLAQYEIEREMASRYKPWRREFWRRK